MLKIHGSVELGPPKHALLLEMIGLSRIGNGQCAELILRHVATQKLLEPVS